MLLHATESALQLSDRSRRSSRSATALKLVLRLQAIIHSEFRLPALLFPHPASAFAFATPAKVVAVGLRLAARGGWLLLQLVQSARLGLLNRQQVQELKRKRLCVPSPPAHPQDAGVHALYRYYAPNLNRAYS